MNDSTTLECWRCEANQLQVIWATLDGDASHTVLWCPGCESPQQITISKHGVQRLLLKPERL